MTPIVWECKSGSEIQIRRCDQASFPWGVAPAYFYLRRTLHISEPMYGHLRLEGFETMYWNGYMWHPSSPAQFSTPEAAFAEFETKLNATK